MPFVAYQRLLEDFPLLNPIIVQIESKPVTYLIIETIQDQIPAQITLAAEPKTIIQDQAATLTWTSAIATSLEIDHSAGPVDANGSTTVSPPEKTIYTITATGTGGTNTASVTVDVDNPFTINIISPADMSAVNRPDVLVYGTVTNAWGNETSIMIDMVDIYAGLVNGGQFAVNHVPLQDGENVITVKATDSEGNNFSKSITVYADTDVDYVRVDASPNEDVAEMETELIVDGNIEVDSMSFTYQGPGTVTFPAQTEDSIIAGMTTPGLYFFTVEAYDDAGYSYQDTVAVNLMDYTELDALLGNRWGALKQALAAEDIEAAANMHHEHSREGFRELYTYLGPQLPTIAQEMPPISPVYIRPHVAKYRMYRDENVNGLTYPIAYYIYFSRNFEGLWSIDRY